MLSLIQVAAAIKGNSMQSEVARAQSKINYRSSNCEAQLLNTPMCFMFSKQSDQPFQFIVLLWTLLLLALINTLLYIDTNAELFTDM